MGRRCIRALCACALLSMTAATAMADTAQNSAVAQSVAKSIKESGQLSNYRLGVKYQDGVAWLLGSVSCQEQCDKAVELAKQCEGVEQVICRLEVEGGAVAAPATETKETLQVAKLEQPVSQAAAPIAPAAPVARRAPQRVARGGRPMPMSQQQAHAIRMASHQRATQAGCYAPMGGGMGPQPSGYVPNGGAVGVSYDNAHMPNYAWPSYAAYPNYSALTYPKQYSPTAWPYIGPFYPYPQVPLGWRKVSLEWDDGWWMLDFSHSKLH